MYVSVACVHFCLFFTPKSIMMSCHVPTCQFIVVSNFIRKLWLSGSFSPLMVAIVGSLYRIY